MRVDEIDYARSTVCAYRATLRSFSARTLFHDRPHGRRLTIGSAPGPCDAGMTSSSIFLRPLCERESALLTSILHQLELEPCALVDEAAACCGYAMGKLSDLDFSEQVSVLRCTLLLLPSTEDLGATRTGLM